MVPTVKFVSTMLEPSRGSNATLKPPTRRDEKFSRFGPQRITFLFFFQHFYGKNEDSLVVG
jgi:hypothetical protein